MTRDRVLGVNVAVGMVVLAEGHQGEVAEEE
jgi:hypothetical protein